MPRFPSRERRSDDDAQVEWDILSRTCNTGSFVVGPGGAGARCHPAWPLYFMSERKGIDKATLRGVGFLPDGERLGISDLVF